MGRERVPPQWLQLVCRDHPSICRELEIPWGIKAIRGQRDVRDRACQELAPPHSSPLIRTTLGQHKFFHVHLQHLFIISTKPQDVTASDMLESFQELQTEEGFHQQQFLGRGERVLWFGLRTEAQETWLSPTPRWPQLCCEGCTGHSPIVGTQLRCLWRELGCITRALPRQNRDPSSVLTHLPPLLCSTGTCTKSFSLSPLP